MNWGPLLKDFGLPTAIALSLMTLIFQMNRIAAEERATHTALLITQMSELRHACKPELP